MKYKTSPIVCPICKEKIGIYDGLSTINPVAKCRNCNKLVVYDIEDGRCRLERVPERMSGSGMRFY